MSAPQQPQQSSSSNTAPSTSQHVSASNTTNNASASTSTKLPDQLIKLCPNVFNCITFAITGILSKSHADIEKMIIEHGGHVTKTITAKTDYLITNEEGYHEMTKLTQEAEHRHLVILDEKFVYDCIARKKFLPIRRYVIEHHEKRGVRKASEMEEEITAKWAWKSEAGWCQFVRVMNERIENAYEHYLRTGRNKICEIDTLRKADFEKMVIHCSNDLLQRRIKREAVIMKETKKNKRIKSSFVEKEKVAEASTSTIAAPHTEAALPINA